MAPVRQCSRGTAAGGSDDRSRDTTDRLVTMTSTGSGATGGPGLSPAPTSGGGPTWTPPPPSPLSCWRTLFPGFPVPPSPFPGWRSLPRPRAPHPPRAGGSARPASWRRRRLPGPASGRTTERRRRAARGSAAPPSGTSTRDLQRWAFDGLLTKKKTHLTATNGERGRDTHSRAGRGRTRASRRCRPPLQLWGRWFGPGCCRSPGRVPLVKRRWSGASPAQEPVSSHTRTAL